MRPRVGGMGQEGTLTLGNGVLTLTKGANRSLRPALVLVRRYVGLLLAVFLLLAGLTGLVLAFQGELDVALNGDWLTVAAPSTGASRLDPFELARRAQSLNPDDLSYNDASPVFVHLHLAPRERPLGVGAPSHLRLVRGGAELASGVPANPARDPRL
jgi:hypothetical protein